MKTDARRRYFNVESDSQLKVPLLFQIVSAVFCCGILLFSAAPSSAQVVQEQQGPRRPLGVPYLDPDSGQICEERTASVEETEYDEQIHCKVEMKRKCTADRLDDLLDNLAQGAGGRGQTVLPGFGMN